MTIKNNIKNIALACLLSVAGQSYGSYRNPAYPQQQVQFAYVPQQYQSGPQPAGPLQLLGEIALPPGEYTDARGRLIIVREPIEDPSLDGMDLNALPPSDWWTSDWWIDSILSQTPVEQFSNATDEPFPPMTEEISLGSYQSSPSQSSLGTSRSSSSSYRVPYSARLPEAKKWNQDPITTDLPDFSETQNIRMPKRPRSAPSSFTRSTAPSTASSRPRRAASLPPRKPWK